MEYRWLTIDEIEKWVNPECERHRWAQLNLSESPRTCVVLGAFDGEKCVGFGCIQFMPYLGPELVSEGYRNGVVSREIADRLAHFLVDSQARGCLVVAGSHATERMAQSHGMNPLEYPVYLWVGSKTDGQTIRV